MSIHIHRGGHSTYAEGHCLMEVVAHLAGEEHSDQPQCACPVLSVAGRRLNDAISSDELRTELLGPVAPLLVGTRATPEVEHARSLAWLDWLVREYTPTWLELVPALSEHAAALRALPVVDDGNAKAAGVAVRAARSAARSAAWSAARSPAWSPAWEAAGDAAWEAARSAARSAAWDGAVEAAVEAAGDAAGDAAVEAAGSAAREAAGAALAPTVEKLQRSAAALLAKLAKEAA